MDTIEVVFPNIPSPHLLYIFNIGRARTLLILKVMDKVTSLMFSGDGMIRFMVSCIMLRYFLNELEELPVHMFIK